MSMMVERVARALTADETWALGKAVDDGFFAPNTRAGADLAIGLAGRGLLRESEREPIWFITDAGRDARLTSVKAEELPTGSWRPIETAPKRGKWIVGAEWQTPPGYDKPELQVAVTCYKDRSWRYRSGVEWTPTHWMPLPDPA